MILHGVTTSFGEHPPSLAWGPPGTAGGDLLHCGPPRATGAQPASQWAAQWAAGESSPAPGHLLHSFTDLGVYIAVSLTYSHSSPPDAVVQCFLPLLKYVITEVLPLLLTGSDLACGGSILELPETYSTGNGGSSGIFSQKPSFESPIGYQNFAIKTQDTRFKKSCH